MNEQTNTRAQIICAYSGLLCPLFLLIGMWPIAQFFPPHDPAASAEEIAAIFRASPNAIVLGMLFIMLGGAFYVPLVAAISIQIRRIEKHAPPMLSYLQLGAGAPISLFIIIPAVIWAAAAYRADVAPPAVTQALNDVGWFFFVIPFTLGFIQNTTIGLAILLDRNAQPVFPRWVGYFNLWIGVMIVDAGLIGFYKSGPFAWNGLIGFFVPATVFFNWFIVMAIYVSRAAKQAAAESRATP